MAKQSFNIWLPLLFALTLAGGLFLGFRLRSDAPLVMRGGDAGPGSQVDELLRFIDARYVDEADPAALNETAIRAVLSDLDPHSSYIPADELRALTESMEGNFEGIGIEFLVVDDTITVVAALPGGPSALAGLQPGDQIIMVEDSVVTGVNEFGIDPASLMRGVANTEVSVSVRRGSEPALRRFTITRAPIPVFSVDAAYNLDAQTTYVKINRFSATTADEFMTALREHMEGGATRDLIIDLRDNPGGYLNQATEILSELFPQKGQLLVYTEGRQSRRVEYETTGRAAYNIQNVAILIDEGSASASEIVAGAVQDRDRGILVGRRTFGKGLVQEQYPLSDGSALRLTVARYYTPSGRSIQRSYEDGEDEYRSDIGRRYDSGELTGGATAEQDSSEIFYTNSGYPVFGGGGITPDYFVPLDTSLTDPTFLRLRQQIPSYLFRYVRQTPRVKKYRDVADFKANFRLDLDRVLPALRRRALADYDEPLAPLPDRLRPELALFFRARLARQLFDASAFYEVYNDEDPIVQRALDLIGRADPVRAARK